MLAYVLIGINVLVFIYQLILGETFRGLEFIFEYAFIPARFAAEPLAAAHTLVTSAFMHGGWMHLIGNMVFLLVFGDNIEDRMGHWRFLGFYLVGGAVACLLYSVFSNDPRTPLVGASGAISAVLGAYIVLFPSQRVLTFIPPLVVPWFVLSIFVRVPRFFSLWVPAWVFIGYWAFIQVIEVSNRAVGNAEPSNVAWWAHIGGFVFGLLVVKLLAGPAPSGYAGSIRP